MLLILPEHEPSSGNVFADIGRPEPEVHLLKAHLVGRIQDIIDERGLSEVAAAVTMGVEQPDLSRMLRGQFRNYPIERLMHMMTALCRGQSSPSISVPEG